MTLTEAEVNGLLTRHLVEVRGVSLDSPSARLTGGDRVVVTGRSSVHHLLEEAALGSVGGLLPRSWQAQPLWLQIGGRVRLDDGARPHLRVDVDEFAVGRQRLPTPLLRVLLDPAAVGLLQWAVPPHIESVAIEPGRVVIRTAPPS